MSPGLLALGVGGAPGVRAVPHELVEIVLKAQPLADRRAAEAKGLRKLLPTVTATLQLACASSAVVSQSVGE